VNKWKYRLIYNNYFGGVTALSKEQFENVNGFSNSFYGWGGEDDDLFHRVEKKGYGVFRYPGNIGRYSMLKHGKVDMNENLDSMMEKSKKDLLTDDGLTTLHYKKLNERLSPLHTWILVKLPPAPPKRQVIISGCQTLFVDSISH
jgi:GT2 family glycosyltransferase